VSDIIQIQAGGGLVNRLDRISSWYLHAQSNNKTLHVGWWNSLDCPGYFKDYFEGINNVVFHYDTNVDIIVDSDNHDALLLWHNDFMPYSQYIHTHLKLKQQYQDEINSYSHKLQNYIACHVRRTDFVANPTHYQSDQYFFDQIDKSGISNIFLATDNNNTQQNFLKNYCARLSYIEEIDDTNSKTFHAARNTSLITTIKDIYTCIQSTVFVGTPGSSLSNFIIQHRHQLQQ